MQKKVEVKVSDNCKGSTHPFLTRSSERKLPIFGHKNDDIACRNPISVDCNPQGNLHS